jgi:hypothetical protein
VNQRKQEAGARTDKGATMFTQTGDDSWKADIECYKCGEKGHLAWECPKKKPKEAEQMHANIAVEEVQDLEKERTYLSKAVPEEWSIGIMCCLTIKEPSIRLRIPVFWRTSEKPRVQSQSIATTDHCTQT